MNFSSMKPHLIVSAIFLALTFAYFSPIIKGKKLTQHDVVQSHAMAKETLQNYEKTGEYSLWTGRMFGGMPVYQIWMGTNNNIFKHTWHSFRKLFASPIDAFLIYLFGFYFFLIVIGFKPLYAVIGTLGFTFSSYNLIIVEAGHLAKVMTIGFSAPILAGIYMTLKKDYFKGFLVTSIFVGFNIMSNHVQITYYLFLVICIWMFYELIKAIKEKEVPQFAKAVGVLSAAAIVGVLPNTTPLLTTKDYVEATIRGEQELSAKKIDGNGLNKDYALSWSYGKMETFTLFIPNFMGGASGGSLDTDSHTYEALLDRNVPPNQAKGFLRGLPLYWGAQPFTSGPVYFGIIMLMLALYGLLLSNDKSKWWLLAATIFCVFISWGKNMDWFYSIFFDYMPMFNKFRSPSMILAIANITLVWISMLGLRALLESEKHEWKNIMKIGGGIAGLCLVFALVGSSLFDFDSQSVKGGVSADDQFEERLTTMTKDKNFAAVLMDGIKEDRAALMSADAWRGFLFALLALACIYLFVQRKIKATHFGIALACLILVDLWMVDKRYLNDDDFKKIKNISKNYSLTPAEQKVMSDGDFNFRVLNTTVNIFNDASPSYYYKTIGGYHAAKLKRYQDLIEYKISPEMGKLNEGFDKAPVLNMLNMKYVIFGKDQNSVALNTEALGSVWTVNKIREVNNPDEEIEALNNFNPREELIVDKRFKEYYSVHSGNSSPSANVFISSYYSDEMKYQFDSPSDELVVFSEIYYHGNKDWIAYIDGVESPHFRVNYVLRAMVVPKGSHEIVFKFKPKAYSLGEKISLAGSSILVLSILAYFGMKYRKREDENENTAGES